MNPGRTLREKESLGSIMNGWREPLKQGLGFTEVLTSSIVFVPIFMLCIVFLFPSPAKCQLDTDLQQALNVHTNEKRLGKAIELYSKVIAANPRSAEAFNWRGMAYADQGKLKEALDDYNQAIKISPDYADAFNNRGLVYLKQGDLDKAFDDFKKASYYEDDFAETHYNMGLVYEKRGKVNLAVDEYKNYLRIRPDASDKNEVDRKIASLTKTPGVQGKEARGEKAAVKKPAPGQRPKPSQRQVKTGQPDKKQVARPGTRQRPGARPGQRPGGQPAFPQKAATPEDIMQMALSEHLPPDVAKQLAGVMVAVATAGPAVTLGGSLLFYIVWCLMLFLMAKKTNTELGWMAFIPIAQNILMAKVADKPWWWGLILAFVPIVNIIFFILLSFALAKARRKHWIWGLLVIFPCTHPLAWIYLGVSR